MIPKNRIKLRQRGRLISCYATRYNSEGFMWAKTLDTVDNGPAQILGDNGMIYSVEIELHGKPMLLRMGGITGMPSDQVRHKIRILDDLDIVEFAADELGFKSP